MHDEVSMYSWAIDSYGLRAAHSQSVLDQVRSTDQLYVSPLTWHPARSADCGGTVPVGPGPAPRSWDHRSAVASAASRSRQHATDLGSRLRELHDQGVLILAPEQECNPQLVADVEASWKEAGLVWRPTNETFSAVMTADQLGVSLITDDSDVRKLACHWHVPPMTVAQLASELAA